MAIPIILILAPIMGVVSIALALLFAKNVMKEDPGNEKMVIVAGYIKDGAKAFIRRQYKTLIIFVACLTVLILLLPVTIEQSLRPVANVINWEQALAYFVGSLASMAAGYLGMMVGVSANTRAAQGCTKGIKEGFDISFFGGVVMGLAVVGAALIGTSALYYWIPDANVILGFSFGASSVALFAKCGGGIYTKTADVGADLVGKAEYDLPEDDPRNPAAIADNVGDNVGDIAGMGSDLFDSYVASIVASMLLASALFSVAIQNASSQAEIDAATYAAGVFAVLPLVLCGIGLIASLLGILYIKKFGSDEPGKALNTGTYLATLLFAGIAAIFMPIMMVGLSDTYVVKLWSDYAAAVIGLGCGVLIGLTSDYYTREDKKPTQNIAKAAEEGHAIVILSGMSYGLISVVPAALGVVFAMALAFLLDGVFGVAIAAVGMLSIVGTIVANDAYGPICDNARGIAEQGALGEDVIRIADKLDSAGNTAKAITKGFAIGAANLTVLALLYSFSHEAGGAIATMDLRAANIMIGAFIGVIIPALFSALLNLSVQKNAAVMVKEIRRQFEAEPKILTGEVAADFERCIDIATKGSLKELRLPSIISIATPLLIGIVFGVAALAAFIAGAILSGFVFAIFFSNAGGSWDNAKKYIEDGNLGGKGTETHKAAITGDTVGDPLKDTSGPSINTLLVVMSLTASIFMGFLLLINGGAGLIQFPFTL